MSFSVKRLNDEARNIFKVLLCGIFDIPEKYQEIFDYASRYESIFKIGFMMKIVNGTFCNDQTCLHRFLMFLFCNDDVYYNDIDELSDKRIINSFRRHIVETYTNKKYRSINNYNKDEYIQRLERYFGKISLEGLVINSSEMKYIEVEEDETVSETEDEDQDEDSE